jgi:hypothetical protein
LAIIPQHPNGQTYVRINASVGGIATITNPLGYHIGSRLTSTQIQYYKDTSKYTQNSTSFGLHNASLILIGQRAGASIISYNGNSTFSTIGDGLTDYEAKALYWIVQKFQTTLGRQVY